MMRGTKIGSQRSYSGFSIVELLIVIALVCVISGFAIIGINSIKPGMYANRTMYQIVDQLRKGRQWAVGHRRAVEIRIPTNDTIQLVQLEIPNGETVLSTLLLANRCRFMLFGGIPDSPDSFGNSCPVDFGGASPVMFLSDGTLVDNQGNPIDGSIFLGIPNHPETARAVTILGSTGKVQCYQWNGTQWIY